MNQSNISANVIKFSIIAILLIIVIIELNKCQDNKIKEQQSIALVNSLNDSMRIYKQKDSSELATISVLQTNKASDFLKINSKDSQIVALQDLVKQYKNKLKPGSSVTIGETTTTVHSTTPTVDTITVTKTKIISDSGSCNPEYFTSKKNQWITYNILANKDSTHLDLLVVNKYAAIIGYNKKKPFADVINYNPYSTTKVLRTYEVSMPPPKRIGVGIIVGVGVTSNFTLGPVVGIGLSYNIINF